MTLQGHPRGTSFPSPGVKMIQSAGGKGIRGEADFLLALLNKCVVFRLLVSQETRRFFAVFKMPPFVMFQLPNGLLN
jgi:hypothetical protein